MDWSNERYVRIYTRDTGDWLALSWDAQSLFMHLCRKVDRAGVLELGKQGKKTVAVVLSQVALWDRLAPALEELLLDGCVELRGDVLVIPNFVPAQEAPQSDRLRQAESRARRREMAQSGAIVTRRASSEPNPNGADTNRDRSVTRGHSASRGVTPSDPSVPSVPSQLDPRPLELIPTEPPEPAFDFEALYQLYPRKEGKQKGIAYAEEHITTAGDFEALRLAIANYARLVEGQEPKFTKHFSSFMRCWKDYLNASPAPLPPRAPIRPIASPLDAQLRGFERDARLFGLVDENGNPT
jgi:hypothetical protein